jgi:hypothetical protein
MAARRAAIFVKGSFYQLPTGAAGFGVVVGAGTGSLMPSAFLALASVGSITKISSKYFFALSRSLFEDFE